VLGTGTSLSSGFIAGDIVTCTVTAYDGIDTGNSASDSVTIGASNTAPSVTSVAITPDPANELDTLTAVPSGWFDAEGDPEDYLYEWTVDSSVVGGDTVTLDASYTVVGSVVTVTITPDDGLLYGSSVTSAALTIGDSCSPVTTDYWGGTYSLCMADSKFIGDPAYLNQSGVSVASGDVDGDGLADLLIGTYWNDDGTDREGKVHLFFGSTILAGGDVNLSAADVTFEGEFWDFFGQAVASAGDVDGDGLDDVLIGAPHADGANAGHTYLFFGNTIASGGNYAPSQASVTFVGEAASDMSGSAVSFAGDVDGDGLSDVLIGADWNDEGGSRAGKTYLFYGSTVLSGAVHYLSAADAAFVGDGVAKESGAAVSSAGDVDGDGLADLLIGSSDTDGRAYLIFASSITAGGTFNLSTADAIFVGENYGDFAGRAVAAAGDVDGDGFADLLIGAPYYFWGTTIGKSYLMLGSTIAEGGTFNLGTADATFIGEEYGLSGHSVSSAGDVDGDGLADLLIGAKNYGDWQQSDFRGKSYLFLGSSVSAGGTFDLSVADAAFVGELADDRSGAVVAAGDVDGDGLADVFIGAQSETTSGTDAGKTYLLLSPYNAPPLPPTVQITPTAPFDNEDLLCSVTAPAVDPDGDPITDYSFDFLVDGQPSGYGFSGGDEYDTLTVPASATGMAEVWTCEVWADDAVALGPGQVGSDEVTVVDPFISVSTGNLHTCAVKATGVIICWGSNGDGQSTPPSGTFTSVNAGPFHTCAVTTAGDAVCWGRNYEGQSNPPAGSFSSVSSGQNHSCGLTTAGDVECWGTDYSGCINNTPTGSFASVDAGQNYNCGVRPSGDVECWGNNYDGKASPPAGTFIRVSAGAHRTTCGVNTVGQLVCWGNNDYGQLYPPGGTFTHVSAGNMHACALTTNGEIKCWGAPSGSFYDYGQATDAPVTGTYTSVGAGVLHSCATTTAGDVVCWGDDSYY
jgi:hypothetical protein